MRIGWLIVSACAGFLLGPQALADSPPERIRPEDSCQPFYPKSAYDHGREGTTKLSYRIAVDGSVKDLAITGSSGRTDLDAAAVECVSGWRYSPATKDNAPVEAAQETAVIWAPPKPHYCGGDIPRGVKFAGVTSLRIVITEEGRVTDAKVVSSNAEAALDQAAIACSSYWRYKPAREDGKPVAVTWPVDVQWDSETPPKLLASDDNCVISVHPTPEQLAGIDGRTQVSFVLVGSTMIDLHVEHSSGNATLDRAAVACISRWGYGETVFFGKIPAFRQTMIIDWRRVAPPPKTM